MEEYELGFVVKEISGMIKPKNDFWDLRVYDYWMTLTYRTAANTRVASIVTTFDLHRLEIETYLQGGKYDEITTVHLQDPESIPKIVSTIDRLQDKVIARHPI